MLYANLVSTKLRRNQFCFHNCNLKVESSLTKLCYRRIQTNLLGAGGADSRICRHIYRMCIYMFIIIIIISTYTQ